MWNKSKLIASQSEKKQKQQYKYQRLSIKITDGTNQLNLN